MKIAVLMGGISEEREVSLASGIQVTVALRQAGHDVIAVDTSNGTLSQSQEAGLLETGIGASPPPSLSRDILRTGDILGLTQDPRIAATDILFLTLHGGSGEDGTIQTLLELSGTPFVGSDRIGCALAMDKGLSKRLFRESGIATPDWIITEGVSEARERTPEVIESLGLPVIVKPPSGGSTVGLTLAHDREELAAAVELALSLETRVLFERYVKGRELTVGILGTQALPVGEIIPEHEIFDYECKYQPGMAQEIFPADLPEATAGRVQDAALAAHRSLRLRDFSRVDFILDGDGAPWCLEANALPGLTGNSLVPKAASAAGISFPDLCDRIATLAWDRGTRNYSYRAGV